MPKITKFDAMVSELKGKKGVTSASGLAGWMKKTGKLGKCSGNKKGK